MDENALSRAHALAIRLGVRSDACTVAGVLAAVRAAIFHRRGTQPSRARRISVAELIASLNTWQGDARARTMPADAPVMTALAALVGGERACALPRLPGVRNRRFQASVAAAVRLGRVIVLRYGRVPCAIGEWRRGPVEYRADPRDPAAVLIDRRELARLLPRLPEPWVYGADSHGMYVARGRWRFYPRLSDLARLAEAAQAAYDRDARAVRLAAHAA